MPKKRKYNIIKHNAAINGEVVKEQEELDVDLKRRIDSLRKQIKRKRDQIASFEDEVNQLDRVSKKFSFLVSPTVAKRRRRKPTSFELPTRSKQRRRNETYFMGSRIHGATKANKKPLLNGLLDALSAKFSLKELANEIVNKKPVLTAKISEFTVKNQWKNYQNSSPNMMRSLKVYYCHNVMGKRKYISIRKANKVTGMSNFVPYKNLAQHIRNIDIGDILDVKSLDSSIDDCGFYRDIKKYCLDLAKLYLHVNDKRLDKLVYPLAGKRNLASKVMLLSIGGDGAPLVGTVFLLSFINIKRRIASSFENFLIFGCNSEETSLTVKLYLKTLVEDIKYLESKVFEVEVNQVKHLIEFKLAMLPNDMKFLSFLAGELGNQATYFTTFADISKHDAVNYKKEFTMDGTEFAKPFTYEHRLKAASAVVKKKEIIEKTNKATSTKRTELTKYIAKLKSRQEFVPLIGPYIDIARCEPLHLKNNVAKELFEKLFNVVLVEAQISPNTSFLEISENNVLKKFLLMVKTKMNCNQLFKKLKQWINESKTKLNATAFSFRFRGHESYSYIKKFQILILAVKEWTNSTLHSRLMQIFYQSLAFRELVSLSTRIVDFDDEYINDFEVAGRKLFCSCSIHDARISPSCWVLCNVAPSHAADILNTYGFGLGINTMEGREQKHQQIKRYSDNSTVQHRWEYVFRHEYVQTVFLRKQGHDDTTYRKKKDLILQL